MRNYFGVDFFKQNRLRLKQRLAEHGEMPIVITANGLLQRGGDSNFGFFQDADFWYLTGIEEPDIVLVIDADNEYLIVPQREASHEAFNGAISHPHLKERSGIKTVYGADRGWQLLDERLKKAKRVASLAGWPAYIERYGLYANPARAALLQRMQEAARGLKISNANQELIRLRMVKQAAEIKAIQAAIDITIDSFKASTGPAKLAKYKHEYELEAEINAQFRRRGAAGPAFQSIVAGGCNAVTLHYVANHSPLKAKQLIVVDVGAEVQHYAADLTRTICQGQPTKRQQAVRQAVLEVQTYAASLLKPGVLIKDYEQQVERFMGSQLKQLGLIKASNHHNVRRYFPHATSHFLGLNVHDEGDYRQPLAPGMVLTVEPGIYIDEEAIGVRQEDDVLITDTGCQVLSQRLPSLLQ